MKLSPGGKCLIVKTLKKKFNKLKFKEYMFNFYMYILGQVINKLKIFFLFKFKHVIICVAYVKVPSK